MSFQRCDNGIGTVQLCPLVGRNDIPVFGRSGDRGTAKRGPDPAGIGHADLTTTIEPEADAPSVYSDELRRKTRWSIVWTLVRIASDQLFSFIIFVILARLLSPSEVGTFAIAVAFSEVGRVIAIQGMVQNIPRARTMSPGLADTVFWTNLGMSVAVALLVLVVAPIIMDLIGQPGAAAPLQALGFVLPIAALGATHLALRLREFGHKSLALRSVLSNTFGGAAAVAAALAGWGIWSLVVQRFVSEGVNAAMSWQAYKWTPGRRFSTVQLRTIWSFGFNLALTQIIGILPRHALNLIIGTLISAAAVGINRTAWRTTELVAQGTVAPFTTVALQTLSRLQTDTAEMVKAYRWMMSRSAMLTVPALIGIGVLAPDAVPAIYGAKWHEAGHIAQIFAFLAVPYPVSAFAGPLLMALGRASTLRKLAFGQLIAVIVIAGLSAPFGLFAVAWTIVARAYLSLPFLMIFLKRYAGVRPRDSLSPLVAPLTASLIMAGAVRWLMEEIRPHFTVPLIAVLICVAVGMVIYGILLYAISVDARMLARHRLKMLKVAWAAR
jgi:O-antigen/teichoic acid export membrane protein